MKVVHVFNHVFPPTYGGIEQHIWDVTRSLRGNFELEVLASSGSRRRIESERDGVRVVQAAEHGRILSTPISPSWWTELRRSRAAALHLHLPVPAGELMALAARSRGPLVATFHADAVRYPALSTGYKAVRERLLSRADRIVVGSQVLADSSPALAHHADRTVVVPYGVDADEWPADPELVDRIRRHHGERIVLFLGRLVAYKGLPVLIDAMATVPATLLVVGSGPERARLEQYASRLAPAGRVRFLGNVTNEERSAYYRAAAAYVLPSVSRAESFGIAMLEAMAHGTPAVSTEVGTATSWVNQHGETGLVVAPRDPAALAAAITTLLDDEGLRTQFGAAAARRAQAHFSKRAMLDGLAGVYRQVGSEAGARTSR